MNMLDIILYLSDLLNYSCDTATIAVVFMMAVFLACHCASDSSHHFFFLPSAHHCYATRMYYALTVLCLLIWNSVLWFDKQLHGFSTLK